MSDNDYSILLKALEYYAVMLCIVIPISVLLHFSVEYFRLRSRTTLKDDELSGHFSNESDISDNKNILTEEKDMYSVLGNKGFHYTMFHRYPDISYDMRKNNDSRSKLSMNNDILKDQSNSNSKLTDKAENNEYISGISN